jgi:two-component system OmpR family response regulator
MSPTILIADDDPHIREVIAFALEKAGMGAETVADGVAALSAVRDKSPDLLILDIGMPEMDGLEVCRELRKGSDLPILFLTARDDEIDRIVGLEIGGDDYVTKPFSPRELVARVRAILKRGRVAEVATKQNKWGDLEIDTERHVCRFGEDEVALTGSEFSLLAALIAKPQMVFTREQIMRAVYGPNIHVSDRTIDSHIRNIRRKLCEAGCENGIKTIHGVGLRLDSCEIG